MTEEIKPQYQHFFLYALGILAAFGLILFLFSKPGSKEVEEKSPDSSNMPKTLNNKYTDPPDMQLDLKKTYRATLNTEKGPISIELFTEETPVTVNNFVFLAKDGFYDNTVFHRVIKGFMIQGGDPLGTGTGGPGYKFNDEKITREYKRGTVAMANSGPNTNGSQFFIMHQDYSLPKSYVIFGQVTLGMETVDKIAESEAIDSGNNEKSKPVIPVKIISIEIEEK